MDFIIVPKIVPTGGAILLSISSGGSAGYSGFTIQRSADGGATWIQIYSGVPDAVANPLIQYLDTGEPNPIPLVPTTGYQYWIQDAITPSISAMTDVLYPVSQISIIQDYSTETWRRLLSAGVSALAVPAGYKNPTFLYQMPLTATPQLPFITMNLDLLQQAQIPIGFSQPYEQQASEALAASGIGVWTIQGLQERRYSIYVVCNSYQERDYYQEAILGILFGLQSTLIIGNQQITFSYQVTQGTIEGDESQPGFYYSQVMLDTTHVAMTEIKSTTGEFSAIIMEATQGSPISITASASGLYVET